MTDKPIKVAIIGGGCAAMTTAWELTQPHFQGHFEVTVYQMGWRLGGKGASGRGKADRIEEHGLHLWMGHYDNAFRVMRECYGELNRDPEKYPIATWQDAFEADPYVGLTHLDPDGNWERLMAHFPPLQGTPGDRHTQALPTNVLGYVSRCVRLLMALLESAGNVQPQTSEALSGESVIDAMNRYLRYGKVLTFTTALQGLHTLQAVLDVLPLAPDNLLQAFVSSLCDALQSLIEPLLDQEAEARYLFEIADLMIAITRGCFRFGLLTHPRGFDAIDEYDCREWLAMNGASDRALYSSFVRGLYDLAFAYEDGDPEKPGMAAGQGLRGGLRMFMGYRSALFWKMQAGMGDIVFAPLFEALSRRGVKFEFFHRLENVAIDDDEDAHVSRLDFSVQAEIKGGRPYEPLIDCKGIPSWPAEPLWEQLRKGRKLARRGAKFESAWDNHVVETKTLTVGKDFDFIVLGVSLGSIPLVCREIIERDQRWKHMTTRIKTVATQCFQLWVDEPLEALGWHEDSPNLSAFVEPFDTWADMSHLIDVEDVPGPPGSLAYFCNVLPTEPFSEEVLEQPDYPAKMRETVRRNAIDFLNRDVHHLWPRSANRKGFRWQLINQMGAQPEHDESAFDSQFWTANVNPSDRYVQSLPGTTKYRISPLDRTYDNLTITGDWTDCGFNFGCVEAAVMSGRLAAHALAEYPPLEDIDGYDHP